MTLLFLFNTEVRLPLQLRHLSNKTELIHNSKVPYYTVWLLLNRGRRYNNTPNKPLDTVPVFRTFPFLCEDMVYVRLLDHSTVSYNNMTSYFGMSRVNPTSARSGVAYSCDPPGKK